MRTSNIIKGGESILVNMKDKVFTIYAYVLMEQITSIVEQITHWGLTGIWKILFAIIIWFVGKKVIALCMKFLKKVFDKGSLDPGVVNFTMSIIRFALYSVLILMVIDELGIQTTSLVKLYLVQQLLQ